ncbi:hypothetical protein GCM10022200_11700 [Microbacterium awajiense]|uniref:Uncharacterized protein n=1 Tax=Microbacterium awajiense TaxID=415214 RepID=A0ABP7AE95_9MICO
MDEPRPRETEAPRDAAGDVEVGVARTGGIAGIRREWRASPPPDQTAAWIELITRCPWDVTSPGGAAGGADRFVWSIRARCEGDVRRAELGDAEVTGAWRDLVDAVRAGDTGGVSDRTAPSSS